MHADLKYVESLEKEIDELESNKVEFSNMYDMLLPECVSNDVMHSYLHSLSNLDAHTELQCLYLHKVKECECLAQKLLKQTEFVSKEVCTELLRSFAKLEKHSISLELTLQQCQEQMKDDIVCKEKASNVFLKEREQYFEIQDLKAQLQDKNIAICELKKLIEKCKGKSVETKFDKPSVVRKPNAQRIPKPSVLGKPASFSDSLEMKIFSKKKLVPKANVSEGLSKPITTKNLPQTARQALGTVCFRNDQFALILGYGDLVQGNIMINRVYYVEGLNHNLFLVSQFCNADLEVAFRKSTCFARDLQGNDLLTDNHGYDLYIISLQETTTSNPICLMAKASPTQAWLWHRRLSHLNFDYINLLSKKDVVVGLPKLKYVKDQLCSSCEVSKAKRSSFKTKAVPSSKGRLNLLHMDLCGPMRVARINGKKYILMKEKEDPCILVGYSTQSKGYRVYNKRTRLIVESIHLRFDEIKEMSETSVANDTSGLVPQRQKASDYVNSNPVPPTTTCFSFRRYNIPSQQELDLLQPDGFVDPNHPDKVYRLRKALYELKQALRACTYGGIQFLGDKLVSWMLKKQDCTVMSSAEAEYMVLSASCAQVMWMRTRLNDYGFNYNKIPLYCDSQSAIAISCNPVQHSCTKHIHTRYHFIKEHVENGITELYFVRTEYQLANMFTKALPEDRFQSLVRRIGMRCLTSAKLEVLANESA
ncbi:retrovirus-related pol polyprotein from transposon TNT 1-94 [Tanacetum coccineum]